MVRPLVRRVVYSLVLQSVEAFLALLTVLVGLPVLIRPDLFVPATISEILPEWFVATWAIGLVVGGVTTLASIVFSNYRVERMGVAILGGTTAVYSIALSGNLPTSTLAAATYAMFALAMAARYWVLGRLLRMNGQLSKMRKRIAELEDEIGGK